VELRDETVWDGSTPFAAVEPANVDGIGSVVIRPMVPAVMDRGLAHELVAALAGIEVPVALGDELTRYEARSAGWTGPLRQPLVRPGPTRARKAGADPRVTAVDDLLPGVTVVHKGFGRHDLTLRANDLERGLRMRVKVPDRDDLMPEVVAAALDTAFAIRRRFPRMASGVQTITIDDGAGGFDDHSRAGSTQGGSGTIYLETSLAFADAMSAQRVRTGGRRGISARVAPPWLQIDGVVAHEIWHNMDATLTSRPAVYVEFNRALGAVLGVETFEHALRGRDAGSPEPWQAGFRRIVDEVSPYATTNMREATAELFKLWWCSTPATPPAPLVARFGALLDEFYPPR
jgi:hypothetical protein